MIRAAKAYVKYIDATSRLVGKIVMYLIFVMMGILLYDTISRTVFGRPNIWAVELTQFFMAAYYLLGGAFTLLIGGHVRMDLFYSRWSKKGKAIADVITFVPLLIIYDHSPVGRDSGHQLRHPVQADHVLGMGSAGDADQDIHGSGHPAHVPAGHI